MTIEQLLKEHLAATEAPRELRLRVERRWWKESFVDVMGFTKLPFAWPVAASLAFAVGALGMHSEAKASSKIEPAILAPAVRASCPLCHGGGGILNLGKESRL